MNMKYEKNTSEDFLESATLETDDSNYTSTNANYSETNTLKKKDPKILLIILFVGIAILLVLISKAENKGASANAEVRNYFQGSGYKVSDIKTEYEIKYKGEINPNQWEDAVFSLISAKITSNRSSSEVYYVLLSCLSVDAYSEVDIDIEYQCEGKSEFNIARKSLIEDTKELMQDST